MPLARRTTVLVALAFASALAGCASPRAADHEAAPGAGAPTAAPSEPAAPSAPAFGRWPAELPTLPGATTVAPTAPVAPVVVAPYTFATAIAGNALEHPRLDIAPGATVRWENRDLVTHSVIGEPGGFVGSGPIPPGGAFSWTFERPGQYAFHCRYHADMTGLVVVA